MTEGSSGMVEAAEERFRATSGRLTGGIALGTVALVLAVSVFDAEHRFPAPVVAGSLLVGVLAWSSMLRPRVLISGDTLVLRNMLETVRIPLAAIEEIAVRQVLAVRAGDRRHVSTAVGRSWRQSMRSSRVPSGTQPPASAAAVAYPDFVEERIRQRCDDARAQQGIQRYSDEQVALAAGVRRQPAWPEIAALVASLAAFAVTLLA